MDDSQNGFCGEVGIKASAGLATCAFFVCERVAVLVGYKQNHEQGGDEDYMRCSVHVVEQAIDFIHDVYLLRAGVKPGTIVG